MRKEDVKIGMRVVIVHDKIYPGHMIGSVCTVVAETKNNTFLLDNSDFLQYHDCDEFCLLKNHELAIVKRWLKRQFILVKNTFYRGNK
jgi:hypothetical protein